MPYLKLQTNQQISDTKMQPLMEKLSSLTAGLLSKSENYVMVKVEPGSHMLFSGTSAPTAFVEFKSIRLPESETATISEKLTCFLGDELKIESQRIYIEFSNSPGHLWGVNGGTF
ncbi:MAG: phenylpyruvate tautomerase MIF-related protein [Bacteroidota bacterium]